MKIYLLVTGDKMKINKNLDLKKELKGKSFKDKISIMKKVLKNMDDEDIKENIENIQKTLKDEINNINIDKQILEKTNTLEKYSIKNRLLILLQNPYANNLLGYKSWKKLNRSPIKNTGIFIYSPNMVKDKKTDKYVLKGYSVKTIFDVKDTIQD
jgi:hypothetical protein